MGTNAAHSCSVLQRQNTPETGCAKAVPGALPWGLPGLVLMATNQNEVRPPQSHQGKVPGGDRGQTDTWDRP